MESEDDEMRAAFADKLVGSLMVVPDVAEMLGYTRQRVLQLIQAGKLEATKPGREWLVMAASVQRFMDARQEGNRT
jgi:excisionase family DNA binding protein